jgi:hypothetical protein
LPRIHHDLSNVDYRGIMTTKLSDELIYELVQHLHPDRDRGTLVALSTTSRVLSDAALDILWATPDVWNLAKCMDELIWRVEGVGDPYESCVLVSALCHSRLWRAS